MAALSTSRRAAAGIALIVAGALFVLAVVLPLLNVTIPYLLLLADVAMVVALVILAVGAVNNTVVKIALFAGAIGWAILALASLGVVALPAGVVTVGAILAAAGGLIGAIVLYVGKEIKNRPAVVFIIAMALGALYLLGLIGAFSLGTFGTIIFVLFGVALIATGVLFRQSERRR